MCFINQRHVPFWGLLFLPTQYHLQGFVIVKPRFFCSREILWVQGMPRNCRSLSRKQNTNENIKTKKRTLLDRKSKVFHPSEHIFWSFNSRWLANPLKVKAKERDWLPLLSFGSIQLSFDHLIETNQPL